MIGNNPNGDAWIIKLLFEEYAAEKTLGQIAKHINEKGGRRLKKKDEFQGRDLWRLLDNESTLISSDTNIWLDFESTRTKYSILY